MIDSPELDTTEDTLDQEAPDEQNPKNTWGAFSELLITVAMIVIFTVGIRIFLVQPFVVDGQSMEPTFHNQEYILVDKLSYRVREPARGEIVVFHPPGREDNFIKRIIGLPGDKIEIDEHTISVNGEVLAEPYLDTTLNNGTIDSDADPVQITVASDKYFVLGDNRDHSKDSREIGQVPKANIIGRAWVVLFPVNEVHFVKRPSYTNLAGQPQSYAIGATQELSL